MPGQHRVEIGVDDLLDPPVEKRTVLELLAAPSPRPFFVDQHPPGGLVGGSLLKRLLCLKPFDFFDAVPSGP
jgi:hypothetical protein